MIGTTKGTRIVDLAESGDARVLTPIIIPINLNRARAGGTTRAGGE